MAKKILTALHITCAILWVLCTLEVCNTAEGWQPIVAMVFGGTAFFIITGEIIEHVFS